MQISAYAIPGLRRNDIMVLKNKSIEFYKNAVAEYFDIPVQKLSMASRKKEIVEARQVAMYLITKYEKFTLETISAAFGRRHHTTVIYSRQAVKDIMDSDQYFRAKVKTLELTLGNRDIEPVLISA